MRFAAVQHVAPLGGSLGVDVICYGALPLRLAPKFAGKLCKDDSRYVNSIKYIVNQSGGIKGVVPLALVIHTSIFEINEHPRGSSVENDIYYLDTFIRSERTRYTYRVPFYPGEQDADRLTFKLCRGGKRSQAAMQVSERSSLSRVWIGGEGVDKGLT